MGATVRICLARDVRSNFLSGGPEIFIFENRRTINAMLKIVREKAVFTSFLKTDVGGGQNCAKVEVNDCVFWKSTVHSAEFFQMHVSVTIIAANNHVRQFSEGDARMIFGK